MKGASGHPREGDFPSQNLTRWIEGNGGRPDTLQALEGDVSLRRYARLKAREGGTLMLALYPGELLPACRRFARTTSLLEEAGVRVPAIRAQDCSEGWMLLEDVGARTLYDLRGRPWSELSGYFEEAVDTAAEISRLDPGDAAQGPPLDAELLRRELRQTWDVFLLPEELAGDSGERRRLEGALERLVERLAADPPEPCHRDLMARNLVPLDRSGGAADKDRGTAESARLAVLDHQDLRLGPPCYDLASLLNDSLFPPPELEERLVRRYLRRRRAESGEPASHQPYHRVGVQRTLKAVGTYAAFARRGMKRHLRLIAPTLDRTLRHMRQTPETAELAEELRQRWADRLP